MKCRNKIKFRGRNCEIYFAYAITFGIYDCGKKFGFYDEMDYNRLQIQNKIFSILELDESQRVNEIVGGIHCYIHYLDDDTTESINRTYIIERQTVDDIKDFIKHSYQIIEYMNIVDIFEKYFNIKWDKNLGEYNGFETSTNNMITHKTINLKYPIPHNNTYINKVSLYKDSTLLFSCPNDDIFYTHELEIDVIRKIVEELHIIVNC